MMMRLPLFLCAVLAVAPVAQAAPATQTAPNAPAASSDPVVPLRLSPRAFYDKVTPSLVTVQYAYDGEFGRREFTGMGLVIDPAGLVMTSMGFVPMQIPDAQMKNFKVVLPGDDETEIEAVFVGRDERADVAYFRTRQPQKWQAVKFEDLPVDIGDTVVSVGLLTKDAGHKSYYCEARVCAQLRGPVPHILVSNDGLANVGSPVFNTHGHAIGLVAQQQGQSVLLGGDGRTTHQAVANPPRFFVPARHFLPCLADPPAEGKPLEIPWLGAPLSGLKKEVAEHFNLKGRPVVLVGDVIEKSPAAKAGLKAGDKIVKLDGQELERGDEPEETWQILMRKIRRMKVGAKPRLTILREADQPTIDVVVTLERQPRQPHEARRFFAEDLGFSIREVVFADTYAKKLPAEQKGVTVAFIRQGGSAASARLNIGDLVTKLNNADVKDLDQFKTMYQDLRKNSPKEAVVLEVIRDRSTEVIRIEPPQ